MLAHLGAMLAHLGAMLAHLGYVGPFWSYVGPSWGYGAMFAHLRAMLARLDTHLGPAWAMLGQLEPGLGFMLGYLDPSRPILSHKIQKIKKQQNAVKRNISWVGGREGTRAWRYVNIYM